MKQFISPFSIEFPLLGGIMSQWPSKILTFLMPNKSQVFPNLGFMKRVCQLFSLININNNNHLVKPAASTKRFGIAANDLDLVKMRLGLHCEGEDPLQDEQGDVPERLSMDEFEGLFKEDEPSFDEIRQAFDVFDQNRDGFIDALELNRVLLSLGLLKGGLQSHNVEVCAMMLRGFGQKGVELVDIHDYVRLLEKGFNH